LKPRKQFVKDFTRLLIEKRRILFLAAMLLVLFFGFFMKNLRMDNSVGIWFLEDDPAFQAYRDFQDRFGNDDVVTLFFSAPEGVFTPENLTLIHRVSEALEDVSYVDRVISLSHVKYMDASRPESLVLENLYDREPADTGDVARVRERVDSWPAVGRLLLNRKGNGTLIMAELKVIENIDAIRGQVIQQVEDAVAPLFAAADRSYRMGGIGVIYNALNQAAIMDSGIFTSLSYVMIFLCLIFFLGSLPFTLLAMAVLFLAMILTLGVFAFAGNSINMITMILPTLIMVIGIADMVHMLVHYTRSVTSAPSVTREDALRETFHRLAAPCLLTTVTTALGFLALASSPMAVIRQFGCYAALGVAVTLGLTFVLTAFACMKIRSPAERPQRAIFGKVTAALDRFLRGMGRVSTERPGTVIGVSLLLLLAGLWGIRYLEANTYPVRYLNEKDPVRISHDIIEKEFGNFEALRVLWEVEENLNDKKGLPI
jgi:predicted RND superfamily exporter protein